MTCPRCFHGSEIPSKRRNSWITKCNLVEMSNYSQDAFSLNVDQFYYYLPRVYSTLLFPKLCWRYSSPIPPQTIRYQAFTNVDSVVVSSKRSPDWHIYLLRFHCTGLLTEAVVVGFVPSCCEDGAGARHGTGLLKVAVGDGFVSSCCEEEALHRTGRLTVAEVAGNGGAVKLSLVVVEDLVT